MIIHKYIYTCRYSLLAIPYKLFPVAYVPICLLPSAYTGLGAGRPNNAGPPPPPWGLGPAAQGPG